MKLLRAWKIRRDKKRRDKRITHLSFINSLLKAHRKSVQLGMGKTPPWLK